jgi:metal-responsive CopG/Arc/MetJ family transcriptional regulator
MKTAISINKELFDCAEGFSRITGLSRSKLYCSAINEYIQNHTPDIITEKLNSYYNKRKSGIDSDLKAAASRLFAGEDW